MDLPVKDFYTSQTTKLLKDFDGMVRKVKTPILRRYGSQGSIDMITAAREEYRRIIPILPYVGGEQPFTQFVISSGWFLAFHQVMRAQGASTHETGELAFELSRTYLQKVPGFARKLLGYMTFTQPRLAKLRQRAEQSHTNPRPGGYVYSFVEGDGVSFDYGVDYQQCATWTLFQQQGAADLTPYLCACDHLYSQVLGWGLVRTTTLSEGGNVCDFRFKHGGPTRVRSSVLQLD